MRKVSYYAMALAVITGLMFAANFALFLIIVISYHLRLPQYVMGDAA